MDAKQIEELFNEHIQNKISIKKTGLSRQIIYNYRNRNISIGTKIDFLFLADLITITKNEPETKKK